MAIETEDEEASEDEEKPTAKVARARASRKVKASTEDFDSWDEEETEEDEEEGLAPTASIRRSRQAARRRATVAGLNFDIIARNKRSV